MTPLPVWRTTESANAYIERLCWARDEFTTMELVHELLNEHGLSESIPPLDVDKAVSKMLTKRIGWNIRATAVDRAGWKTYRVLGRPEKKKVKPVVPEAELPHEDPKRWYCDECQGHPIAAPVVLLGGKAKGRCPDCKKERLFSLR